MSILEQGPKGMGGVVTSSEKAIEVVESAKSATDEAVGSSGGECGKKQYTIGGTVKASQKPIDDVTVSGGGKSTESGPKGAYDLTFDEGTAVTLTFALDYYTTVTRDVPALTGNVKLDVSITRKRWKVSGKLVFGAETAVDQRVTLNYPGGKEQAKLTANEFRFVDIPEGEPVTIAITTSIDHLDRTDDITIPSLTSNLENQNFTFTRKSITVTGTVKVAGDAFPGATVTLEGKEPVVTGKPGTFAFASVVAGKPYTLTAVHKHFTFAPYQTPSLTVDPQHAFAGTRKKWSVKGTVKFADHALKQVTVKIASTLLDAPKTVKTGAGGTYAFPDLPAGGKYTLSIDVNAAKYNVTASPAAIDELSQDETGRDFDGAWKNWTFSGNVKEQLRYAQVNLAKVLLDLSGHADAPATTNGAGNYSFTVAAGGTYDVTPAPLPPFGFAPGSVSAANVTANMAGDFIATWTPPNAGIARDQQQTTYGLDVFKCATCQGRPMTHAASPIRDTATSYAKCGEVYSIIRVLWAEKSTMVGVLVCDDGGIEKYIAAHSGGDVSPDGWQLRATNAGFTVATYAAPVTLVTRGRNPLASTYQNGNNEVGKCAAPKLVQAANQNGWTPLAMTEMSLNLLGYTNGQTVSSCVTCQSIVAQMLCDA